MTVLLSTMICSKCNLFQLKYGLNRLLCVGDLTAIYNKFVENSSSNS